MQIGELFLNLGLKGTEKTVGALSNVGKGFSEVKSMSLEAKAGILAAFYAFEQFTAASGKVGTNLTNFNALTGDSAKTLQQYEYAARQAGVSNQEVEGSFKSLQTAMSKTLLGEGAPKGLARVSLLTGGISQKDIQEFAKHPELLIQKLQQYAQRETNIGLRNETLRSFGISEGMIAGLVRGAFNPNILKGAPTYTDREIDQLNKANIAWANLGNKVEMAIGHFNAKHGLQLVKDISKITDQVVRLAEAFTKLADKIHLFEGIGKVFEGWNKIFQGASAGVDALSSEKGRSQLGSDMKDFVTGIPGATKEMAKELFGLREKMGQKVLGSPAPQVKTLGQAPSNQNNNVNIHNNFQHSGVDPKQTGDSVKKSVNQAIRQLKTQAQAT